MVIPDFQKLTVLQYRTNKGVWPRNIRSPTVFHQNLLTKHVMGISSISQKRGNRQNKLDVFYQAAADKFEEFEIGERGRLKEYEEWGCIKTVETLRIL